MRIHLHVCPTYLRCKDAFFDAAAVMEQVGGETVITDHTITLGNDRVMFRPLSSEDELMRLRGLVLETLTNHHAPGNLVQHLWHRVRPTGLAAAKPVDRSYSSAYLNSCCTEDNCSLCRTPVACRKPGMRHAGLTVWDRETTK